MFVIIGVLATIGLLIWRVQTAQKLASQSGLDPGIATQMALLTDDGLDATYLAASLRQPPMTVSGTPVTPGPAKAAAAQRLGELKSLLDQGLVTPDEYEQRRRAVIDTI